jgi:hypothetical protein
MTLKLCAAAAIIALIGGSGGQAWSVTLPPVTGFGSYGNAYAGASIEGAFGSGMIAKSSVDYYFDVVGPSNSAIPFVVNGVCSVFEGVCGDGTNVPPSGTTYTFYSILTIAPLSLNASIISEGICGSSGPGNCPADMTPIYSEPDGLFASQTTVSSNTIYDVNITSYAEALGPLSRYKHSLGGVGSDIYAPYLVVSNDKGFRDKNPQYSVQASPGVINSPAPEPATWALMLVGFGAVGIGLRSRRLAIFAT